MMVMKLVEMCDNVGENHVQNLLKFHEEFEKMMDSGKCYEEMIKLSIVNLFVLVLEIIRSEHSVLKVRYYSWMKRMNFDYEIIMKKKYFSHSY